MKRGDEEQQQYTSYRTGGGESEGVEHDAAAILLTQEATLPQEGTTQSIL